MQGQESKPGALEHFLKLGDVLSKRQWLSTAIFPRRWHRHTQGSLGMWKGQQGWMEEPRQRHASASREISTSPGTFTLYGNSSASSAVFKWEPAELNVCGVWAPEAKTSHKQQLCPPVYGKWTRSHLSLTSLRTVWLPEPIPSWLGSHKYQPFLM